MSADDLRTWIQFLNDLPALVWFLAIYVLLELAVDVSKRSPFWLLRRFLRPLHHCFWAELHYMRALAALRNGNDARAVELLIAVVGNAHSAVRRRAAVALGETGDRRAVDPLIRALKDEDAGVRASAAEALGQIGDRRAAELLVAALEDDDSGVRQKAAEALGEIRDTWTLPYLERMAKEDKDRRIAYAARGAIERIRARSGSA